jgi:enoyl-CoA hydratase/carnithine racemase
MDDHQNMGSSPHQSGPRGENDTRAAKRIVPDSLMVRQRGPVALLRLSRPTKANAIDEEMIAGIKSFFSALPEGTRAVIVHGEGKHFSAGADLAGIRESGAAALLRGSRSYHSALDQVEYGAVPVIAVLHGAVIGGGLELAAAAHIRVAERSAYYALPEGMRGIFVGGGAAVRVPRLIGTARMIDMMLTGRTYRAEEGARLGFSQYVVDDGQGLAKAIELADRIATNAVLSNFGVVQALPRIARADPEAGLLLESLMVAIAASDEEAKARLHAFLEKRAPKAFHSPAAAE